ncbi:unnamed protein product [Adineta ricciae]|uniref:Uncharacterized protein n=2 Tax=Adineta ricciae TaxID=249248 RepID=A0A813QIV5_ADIRI|nr:unnamed protein product [Adineta ricciae]CAF1405106.1 unnamed protein product [Adineta ricciae]
MSILRLSMIVLLFETSRAQYSVYHSRLENFDFDCLYAPFIYEEEDNHIITEISYQAIPYCRRPSANEEQAGPKIVLGNVHNTLTFADLYEYGITTDQLLEWSAPIDLVEQYAMNPISQTKTFYNCSSAWFGSECQYKFDENSSLSFYEIAQSNFLTRTSFSKTLPDLYTGTCYSFLTSCSYRFSPLCLDWHEICDGKRDCINGEDEENCRLLEMNDCPDGTYRCHYGGQCVPLSFLRDKYAHFDCLDGTDETKSYEGQEFSRGLYCITNPTFQCEERISRSQQSYHCGDGQYYSCDRSCPIYGMCSNGRFLPFPASQNDSFLNNLNIITFTSTLKSMTHIFNNTVLNFNSFYSLLPCESNNTSCLSKWYFKARVLHPHPIFHFIYLPHRSFSDFYNFVRPDLICFDPDDCSGIVNNRSIDIGLNNGFICYHTDDIVKELLMDEEDDANIILEELYHRCKTTDTEHTCLNASLFHCSRSLKCISKHRLVDGISDCYYNEDELFDGTCLLNGSNRFTCPSKPEKCLSQIAVYDTEEDCEGKEDEMNEIEYGIIEGHVPVGLLCDTFVEPLLAEANETDETNCEYWSCDNPYTRCDGNPNCPDFIDELDCPIFQYTVNTDQCQNTIVTNTLCYRLMLLLETKFKTRIMSNNYTNSVQITGDRNITTCFKKTGCTSLSQLCSFDSSKLTLEKACSTMTPSLCQGQVTLWWAPIAKRHICGFDYTASTGGDYSSSFFTSYRLGYFPSLPSNSTSSAVRVSNKVEFPLKIEKNWYCNRGILIFYQNNQTKSCLCPPSYFGSRCQWQSQRISLTIQFICRLHNLHTIQIFQVLIELIDQQTQTVESYEQIIYIPKENCGTKYNVYLLYPTRPKNLSRSYSIHIDIYDKKTFTYFGGWFLPVPFHFLPVNRIATQLVIPLTPTTVSKTCPLLCGRHGRCVEYANVNKSYFCRCQEGYSGSHCHIQHNCTCSPDSLCHSSSICICPLKKFGPKCYIDRSICERLTNPCKNNGHCVPVDDRIGSKKYYCLCPDGFYGKTCQYKRNRIDIKFDHNKIHLTPFVFVHFIKATENSQYQHMVRLKKVHVEQNLFTIYIAYPFHVVFMESIDRSFYLAVLREKFLASEHIQTNISANHQCFHISRLMNETFLGYVHLRRMKYYPLLCQENVHLKCFHDERQMCICDSYGFSNCFKFNPSSISYDCQGRSVCENKGLCIQDNPSCPTQSICICDACHYGARCQFSTRGSLSSLDHILAYRIIPNLSIYQQSSIVLMTILITSVMLFLTIINGFLSIIAFRIKGIKNIGCGLYLSISSVNSICLLVMLVVKVWHLILSQSSIITSRLYLRISCKLLDMFLNILITMNDWFGGCIAVEQIFITFQENNFNQIRSKKLAKRIIFAIYIFSTLTNTHESFYRQLVDDFDIDEKRTWCIALYPPTVDTYNTTMSLVHFLVPLSMSFFSTLIIILLLARSNSTMQPGATFRQNLKEQFHHHKHNLIIALAVPSLSVPRLIISFISGCMKSSQDPSLYLISYLFSFVPSMTTFIVFILTADGYKQELSSIARQLFARFRRQQGKKVVPCTE